MILVPDLIFGRNVASTRAVIQSLAR